MGTQLPTLTAAGAVTLDSAEQFHEWWDQWVARGALAVVPARELTALEQLEVRIDGLGLAPVTVRCEVVRLDPARTLLRLLDAPPEKPALAAPPPEAAAPPPDSPAPPTPTPPLAAPSPPDDAPPPIAAMDDMPIIVVPPPPSHLAPIADDPPLVPPAPPPRPVIEPPPVAAPEAPAVAPSAASRTQDLDASLLMPDPTSAAPPLERFATPGPQVLPPEARAMLQEAAPPSPPRAPPTPPTIELEPVAPVRAVPVVVAEPEPAPIVLEPVAAPAPAPPAASAPVEAAPSAPAPVEPAAAAPAPAAPSARPALPPYFTGDALRFGSDEDFTGNRQHLEGVGAILAVADGQLPVKAIEVRLIVGDRETRLRAKVTLAAAAPGTAVVQAVDRGGFLPLVAELTSPVRAPTPGLPGPLVGLDASATSRIPATAFAGLDASSGTPPLGTAPMRAFSLPKQGQLKNPTTPQEILSLPMGRAPTEQELARPSVPLLLRWLRSMKGVYRLEVTAEDHPVYSAVFVEGREVRTPASLATLAKSLSLPQMSYQLLDLGRPPEMTTRGRTLHLIGEVIRALSARIDTDVLHSAFPAKAGKCVRGVQHVVESLGLPAQHARFVKADLDGTEYLDEVARAAVGARTVWETLYLLQVFDGVAWDDPPTGKATSSRTGTQRTLSVAQIEAANDEWATFESKDHFNVLGLHWSCAPSEVAPAYQRMRSDYGSGGIKRPSNPQTADKIMKRIEEAYRVLADATQRRAYRREKYNLVWPHQAQLLVAKAKLELYRKNYQDAKNILDAAEDISPSEEARALLTALSQAARKPSG